MIFPTIGDISTKEIVSIHQSASIADALDKMLANDIREIVVETGKPGIYGSFTVQNVISAGACASDLLMSIEMVGFGTLRCVDAKRNLLEVYSELGEQDDYLGLTDSQGALIGIVSETDIISSLDPKLIVEKQKIGDLLSRHAPKTVPIDTALGDVLICLSGADDAVILTDRNQPAGIITTKDAIRLISNKMAFKDPASRHMSTPLETFRWNLTIKEALEVIQERHFKRIVIADGNGQLLGVISQKELISLAYNRWSQLLHGHTEELRELIELLEKKTIHLERLATTDALTGIFNRTKFGQVLEQEIGRYYRYRDAPFSLLMFDIDRFKQINDQYGHLKGDEVLKWLTGLVGEHVRDADTFVRWGGEEFTILMPVTQLAQVHAFAERLRKLIETCRLDDLPGITVSIGVAEYKANETIDEFTKRVDQALYRAKSLGRNRVEAAA